MKFIHLTDTHLTTAGHLFDLDVCERLRQAVSSINRNHTDAEMVMITGDIAHWGEPGAYDHANEILGELQVPWYPIAGNHDEKPAFFDGLSSSPHDEEGHTCYRLDTSAGMFLCLDSTVDGTHAGELDDAQLTWLDEQLSGSEQSVFLFMHHHPVVSGIQSLDVIKLKNSGALAAVIDKNEGCVRHIFFGHMHRSFHGSWRGLPFSTVKATAHQVPPIFEDTPLESSREMPAYAVVFIDGDSVCVHDVSFLEEDTAFAYHRDDGRPESLG